MYASGCLKDDANALTYFITWDENNNNNKNNKKWTNKEPSKIKQQTRFDSTLEVNSDFAFFVFERTYSQPRRHLHSHLAMQRLSSEATTSCPNRDAPALPERDQRADISFF